MNSPAAMAAALKNNSGSKNDDTLKTAPTSTSPETTNTTVSPPNSAKPKSPTSMTVNPCELNSKIHHLRHCDLEYITKNFNYYSI